MHATYVEMFQYVSCKILVQDIFLLIIFPKLHRLETLNLQEQYIVQRL